MCPLFQPLQLPVTPTCSAPKAWLQGLEGVCRPATSRAPFEDVAQRGRGLDPRGLPTLHHGCRHRLPQTDHPIPYAPTAAPPQPVWLGRDASTSCVFSSRIVATCPAAMRPACTSAAAMTQTLGPTDTRAWRHRNMLMALNNEPSWEQPVHAFLPGVVEIAQGIPMPNKLTTIHPYDVVHINNTKATSVDNVFRLHVLTHHCSFLHGLHHLDLPMPLPPRSGERASRNTQSEPCLGRGAGRGPRSK